MKPITIDFTDDQGKVIKTYSTCSVKTGAMDNIFDIAEKAQEMESAQEMKIIRGFFKDLKATIVDIFGNQFTYDELNKGVEQSELMKVFNEICANLQGAMIKKQYRES
jgi:hypothetical protein